MNNLTLSRRLKLSDLDIKLNPEVNRRVLVELANRIGSLYPKVPNPKIGDLFKQIHEQATTKICSEFALEYYKQQVRDLCNELDVAID